SLLLGLFFMLLFYYAGKGIRHFLSNYFLPKSGLEPALIQGISTLVSYTVIIIGTITALSATGIDLTALTVVVGGLSVGLGFGLQAIVSNFISGFVLLFEKSVGPGDIINIADKTGTVQHVGIRSITILTRDHIELIVPNSYYLTEVVTNLTRTSRNIRLAILVGVSYNADPKEVKEALLASAETDYVMKLPAAEVQFLDFGESSLDFRLLIWTNRPELSMVIGSNIRYNIWEQLKKRNIEIPFPQRDLHIRSGIEHLSGTVKNTSAKK
ncbi:MAG: mechanosensitive ion channel, partial [Calditrichaeota bacterium]|nr:mechanosensitive ion channel [Calditrichota bacterium]